MEKTLMLTSTKARDYDRPGYDSDGYNSEVGILPKCNKVLQIELLSDASNALTSAGIFSDLVKEIDQFLKENYENDIKQNPQV